MGEKKLKKGLIVLFILLFVFIGIPLISAGLSFLGRITPESVIPDSFTGYAHIPNPVKFIDRVLDHEPLPDILAEPGMSSFLPIVNTLIESKIFENRYVRFMGRGSLDAALMQKGEIIAAWDMGVLSPLLRFLPNLAGQVTIPNLYYVQAGKLSRLEYRMDDGTVFFIGPYKNLLVISNNTKLFESVLNGTSRDGDLRGSTHKTFYSKDFDIGLLVSSKSVIEMIGDSDPAINAVMNQLTFPGLTELTISVFPKQLDIAITSPLSSPSESLNTLISNNSRTSLLLQYLPENTQYSTLISIGSFKDILNYVVSISGPEMAGTLKTADSSSKLLLGMSLDELLFSWTGTEVAVFGLEGRPFPVFAVEIKDEKKRQEVFDKAFSSLVVKENISSVIDGTRIPQIQIPNFLGKTLNLFGITVPSPYYTVQQGFLFISESPENLVATVNSIRRNSSLPKTETWKTLAKSSSDQNSFSLFYSLDRSLPFFLKGNTGFDNILKLYRQGLARITIKDKVFKVTLSVIPGLGKGLNSVTGYPLDMGGRMGNILYSVMGSKKGEARIFFTGEGRAYSLDPSVNIRYELAGNGKIHVIPAQGIQVKSMADPMAWVINDNGIVSLVNGNMEPQNGFPLVTGGRLSSPPAAHNGKVYLPDQDGSVYVIGSDAKVTQMNINFDNSLKSPPNFNTVSNKQYMGAYPKSFMGELWLTNIDGAPYPGWPVFVSSIAYGSPRIFSDKNNVRVAFITQAGELSLFDESGSLLPEFPLTLTGVFYVQPEFDGQYLWIIAQDGTLYQVSLSGEVLFQKIPGLTAEEEAHIQLVDVDNDKIPEVFITGEGNNLFGYSRSFNSLDGFPLPVWGKPVFGDFNGDGKIECIGMGLDNALYRWQFK